MLPSNTLPMSSTGWMVNVLPAHIATTNTQDSFEHKNVHAEPYQLTNLLICWLELDKLHSGVYNDVESNRWLKTVLERILGVSLSVVLLLSSSWRSPASHLSYRWTSRPLSWRWAWLVKTSPNSGTKQKHVNQVHCYCNSSHFSVMSEAPLSLHPSSVSSSWTLSVYTSLSFTLPLSPFSLTFYFSLPYFIPSFLLSFVALSFC